MSNHSLLLPWLAENPRLCLCLPPLSTGTAHKPASPLGSQPQTVRQPKTPAICCNAIGCTAKATAKGPCPPPHLSLSVSSSIFDRGWPVYSAIMRFKLACGSNTKHTQAGFSHMGRGEGGVEVHYELEAAQDFSVDTCMMWHANCWAVPHVPATLARKT
jgi:hypothetical protein